jgi:hypothetical protein
MLPLKMITRTDSISSMFRIMTSNKVTNALVIDWYLGNPADIHGKEDTIKEFLIPRSRERANQITYLGDHLMRTSLPHYHLRHYQLKMNLL